MRLKINNHKHCNNMYSVIMNNNYAVHIIVIIMYCNNHFTLYSCTGGGAAGVL